MELTERQQKTFDFLADFKLATETDAVKSMDGFIKKHNVQAVIGTIIKTMGVISKSGTFTWNYQFPCTAELAVQVDEQISSYFRISKSLAVVKEAITSGKRYSISLKEIWEPLGYYKYTNAKNSLLNSYELDKDFVLLNDQQNYPQNQPVLPQIGRPEENIYLTERCFYHFINTASTATAKMYAAKVRDLSMDKIELLTNIKIAAENNAVDSNKADDLEAAISMIKNFSNRIVSQIDKNEKAAFQLEIEFDMYGEKNLYDSLAKQVTELITRNLDYKQLNNSQNGLLAIEESTQKRLAKIA